jgi:hypothetical protein
MKSLDTLKSIDDRLDELIMEENETSVQRKSILQKVIVSYLFDPDLSLF